MHILKKYLEGKLPFEKELIESFYKCALCANCNEICPAGIDYINIVSTLREYFVKQGKLPEDQKLLRNNIVEHGNPFAKDQKERGRWLPPKYRMPQKAQYLYFVGCSNSYSSTRTARSIIRILETVKFDFTVLGSLENCCGDPLLRMGERNKAEKLIHDNLEQFKKLEVKTIFTSCAGCYKTLKTQYHSKAEVIHISRLFEGLINSGTLEFKKDYRNKIIYFDGCDIGRHCETYEEPRNVLKAVPGVELMEFDYNRAEAVCCGGPFASSDPVLAAKIAGDRVREAEQKGADIIATSCPTCMVNLREGARQAKINIQVQDIPMLLPGLI